MNTTNTNTNTTNSNTITTYTNASAVHDSHIEARNNARLARAQAYLQKRYNREFSNAQKVFENKAQIERARALKALGAFSRSISESMHSAGALALALLKINAFETSALNMGKDALTRLRACGFKVSVERKSQTLTITIAKNLDGSLKWHDEDGAAVYVQMKKAADKSASSASKDDILERAKKGRSLTKNQLAELLKLL